MHTNKEQDPWWRVDLGKEYIITGKKEGDWVYLYSKINLLVSRTMYF